jgi:hypothetical protein
VFTATMLESIEQAARRSRNRLFLSLLETLERPLAVLDVGGTAEYWSALGIPHSCLRKLVLLNTYSQPSVGLIETVVGDARDLSRYVDQEFDVVCSNSVIGHVGGAAEQLCMAQEIRRVGRRYFVQTPNHAFPIDWRTVMPFFHFLPPAAQAWCFQRFAVGTYRKAADPTEALYWATRVRNIRRTDLSRLFPDGTVVNERVVGLTKSFMIHNFPSCIDA